MGPKSATDDDDNLDADLQTIKQWLAKQPHLPPLIADPYIKRFLHCCDRSLERTKNLLDMSYTVRSQSGEIFANRDPNMPDIQSVFAVTDMVPLPHLTKDNYKLFIYRLADPDPDKFNFLYALKAFMSVADVRMLLDESFSDGEVPIFDMNDFTLRHLSKMGLILLKKYMVYTQEAHPVRLKQIHVVNVPSYLDKVLAIIKPFMKSEVASLLHFHLPNSTTLYDYVPKELLPEEYGGSGGKLVTFKNEWWKKVNEQREYLIDPRRWLVDESKRPISNKNGKQMFGIQGSFRSLQID